ncbi:MAG: hypothetical protein IPO80_12940 [Propionibacteriaceae bacterium]|nr:hypothetical protein [Propionibacteriaceae bacterium]
MIRFEDVSKTYDGQTRAALRHVNVGDRQGDFTFLVGASGSGNPTFLRLILREYLPTRRVTSVAGRDLPPGCRPLEDTGSAPPNRDGSSRTSACCRERRSPRNVSFAMQVIGKPQSLIRKVVPETLELVRPGGKRDRLPEGPSGGETATRERSPRRS